MVKLSNGFSRTNARTGTSFFKFNKGKSKYSEERYLKEAEEFMM